MTEPQLTSPSQSPSQNLWQRIVVALLAIPFLLALFYAGSFYFLIFAVVVSSMSMWEFLLMTEAKGVTPQKILTLILGLAITVSFYFKIDVLLILIPIVFLITLMELFSHSGKRIETLGVELFALLYISLSLGLLINLREKFPSHYFVMMIVVLVWASDTFAYFGGVWVGGKLIKRKFFERISPKKTWEGFLSGLLGTMVVAHFFYFWFLEAEGFRRMDILVIALAIGLFGPIGDLMESMLKRDSGVKDSSGLLLGHGGMFDRFDALIFVVPAIYFYVTLAM